MSSPTPPHPASELTDVGLTAEQESWLPEDPTEDLLDALALTPLGSATSTFTGLPGDEEFDLGSAAVSLFVGRSQKQMHHRVYGGQVLAQSLMAAGLTVAGVEGPPRSPHSLHGYFIRPGDDSHPIRFAVEALRDGRSYSVRRVQAIQYGKPILVLTASFQTPAEGLDHQTEMPTVTPPDQILALWDLAKMVGAERAEKLARARPIDLRHVEGNLYVLPGAERTASQHVWLRTPGKLPDDPLLHACVLAYNSDFSLLESVLRRHGLAWSDSRLRPASLDHSMWFHRPTRADDWVLYAQYSPSAQSGRGLGIGSMYASDGTLVATTAQEGMLRLKSDEPKQVRPEPLEP